MKTDVVFSSSNVGYTSVHILISGETMAIRRKSTTRKSKSKRSKPRSKPRKKSLARSSKAKKAAKKHPKKTPHRSVARRTKSRRKSQGAAPVVEDTIIDIVDEPVPGVMRVTEIEEVTVSADDDDEE